MRRSFQILILLMISVFSIYASGKQRTFNDLGQAADWIISNRLDLIVTKEEKAKLSDSEVLNHSEADRDVIRDSFNKYIKGDEIKRAYVQANIQEIFKVLHVSQKNFIPDISETALVNSLNEPLGKNFDNLTTKVMGIRWINDSIELTVTIEGKNFIFPLVLNALETEQGSLEPVTYINNSLEEMNVIAAGKTNVKITYKKENGDWVLDDQNFLKLLNGLVFVKYYNRNIEDSLQ